jgi:hypothetical protein
MARGDLLRTSLNARIDNSGHSITLNYPAVRPIVVADAPAVAPLSPLTGIRPQPALVQSPAVPANPPVTMTCLWLDADTMSIVETNSRRVEQAGWVAQATALATVKVEDAAKNPDAPTRETIFDDIDFVEHDGQRFRVIKVSPVGSSFTKPFAYAVWLSGAAKQ